MQQYWGNVFKVNSWVYFTSWSKDSCTVIVLIPNSSPSSRSGHRVRGDRIVGQGSSWAAPIYARNNFSFLLPVYFTTHPTLPQLCTSFLPPSPPTHPISPKQDTVLVPLFPIVLCSSTASSASPSHFQTSTFQGSKCNLGVTSNESDVFY